MKIIVSVPAGGGVDTVTRIFAARLQQRLGQPFVIENRGGGGGNIGAEAVYTAEPDGYTLLATQPAPITSNIALYKKLNFDPVALEPVAVMSKFPNVLLVRQDFPAKTVQEFIAYVKANPGKVTYASQGVGHDLAPDRRAVRQGDRRQDAACPLSRHRPGAQRSRRRPRRFHLHGARLGLQAARRRQGPNSRGRDRQAARYPAGHPDLIEVGVADFVSDTWNAISAPPKTPAPIIAKLNRAINDVLTEPETKTRFRELNLMAAGGSPAGHGEAQEGRDRALEQGDPRRRHSAGVRRAHAMMSGVSWSSI